MNTHTSIQKLLTTLDKNFERWLLLVFYIMIVITVGVEVLRRFGLSYSSIWAEEIARYSFIYLVWIGLAMAVKERSSIKIDVITQALSKRNKGIIYMFADIVMVFVSIIALYYSTETFLTSLKFGSVTHGLRISNAWFLFAVPFGFLLVLLRLTQSIRRDFIDIRNGNNVFEGTKLFD